jgi:hypothetical protein
MNIHRPSHRRGLLLTALLLTCLSTLPAQDAKRYSVKDINEQAGVLAGVVVETYGTVDSIVQREPGKVGIYRLKGDEGNELNRYINVHTNGTLPTPGDRKEGLKGNVTPDSSAVDGVQGVYLSEVVPSRVEWYVVQVGDTIQSVTARTQANRPDTISYLTPGIMAQANPVLTVGQAFVIPPKRGLTREQIAMIGGGALAVLVIGFLWKQKSERERREQEERERRERELAALAGGKGGDKTVVGAGAGDDDSEITIRKGDTTVRINDERTIVFLPGHLEVKSGGRRGAKIPLCGGYRVTVGRQHAAGRGANFIGLEDPSKGLSRNQALISYDKASDAFLLEAQKSANPTMIDGRALADGETVTLKQGMEISFLPDYTLAFHRGLYRPSTG